MYNLVFMSDSHFAPSYPYSRSAHLLTDTFVRSNVTGHWQIADYCAETGSTLIHGGDLFDRDRVGSEIYFSNAWFSRLERLKVPVIMNIGNHEIAYNNMPSVTQSITNLFGGIRSVLFKDPYSVIDFHGLNIYLVPYKKDTEFFDAIKDIEIKQPAALCIHQNLKGVTFPKPVGTGGLSVAELGQSFKNKFKFIVCGHIHHHQYVDKGVPIFIPGAVSSFDFKDENSVKHFFAVTLDKSFNVMSYKSIPIKSQILFCTMTYKEFIDKNYKKIAKNRFFKIVLEDDDEKSVVTDTVMGAGAKGCVVVPHQYRPVIGVAYERAVSTGINEWMTKYFQRVGLDDYEIERAAAIDSKIFSAS